MISRGPPTSEASPGHFRVGEWLIDPALDEISRGSEVVKLEPRMMRLLCRLAEARGQVVRSQDLLDSVWAGVVVGPASVYQAISGLRKVLGDTDATPTYIATVLGKGYRLIAPVELAANVVANAPTPAELKPAATPLRRRRALRLGLAAGVASLAVIAVFLLRKEQTSAVSAPAAATRSAPDLPSIAMLSLEAAEPDDPSESFAACMSSLLQNRLATQKGLLVVSMYSADTLKDPRMDVRDVGKRLHAKYLLRGDATRVVDQLRVNVTLVDTSSGAAIWSKSYVRAAHEITALREEIVVQIGTKLNVRIGSVGNVPIDLTAYEMFMRGEQAMQKSNAEGYSAAKAIFYRTTVLYPDFARAYLGFAQSLNLLQWTNVPGAKNQKEVVIKALDRALELDPEFGEAMIWRADYISDPIKAEEMYRRGLDLVPNYANGALHYAEFLSGQGRAGEAIDVINGGLRGDPLSYLLLQAKASILAYDRGDIPAQQDVLRELIATHPNFSMPWIALGWSRYAWNGETAEGIRLFERVIAQDPAALPPRIWAASAYLDVDDPDAALSVANGTPYAPLQVAQFRRDAHPIALLSANLQSQGSGYWDFMSSSPIGDAVRDEAIVTGNYAPALTLFEKVRSNYKGSPIELRGMELVHAHTLILSGDTERGRELAKSLLQLFDAEEAGRPKHWFARDRASVYAMLGDDERALSELTESVRRKDLVRWWYTAEIDPLFDHLRKDPRFQALAAEVKRRRAEQRALLEEMRRKGEVPQRP